MLISRRRGPQDRPPHRNVVVQRLRDWCLPLETNEEMADLVVMAHTVRAKIDVATYSSIENIFGEGLNSDDALTRSVRAEALRYQMWHYWRHACGFQEKVIMMAKMDLTFWRAEEEWCMAWLGRNGPDRISNKFFLSRVGEILYVRQHGAMTDLPPQRTIDDGSSRINPADKTWILSTGIALREPASTTGAPTETPAPVVQGKAPMTETEIGSSMADPVVPPPPQSPLRHPSPTSHPLLLKNLASHNKKMRACLKNLMVMVSLASTYMQNCQRCQN